MMCGSGPKTVVKTVLKTALKTAAAVTACLLFFINLLAAAQSNMNKEQTNKNKQ